MSKRFSTTKPWTLCGLGSVIIWWFTGVVGGNINHVPILQVLILSQAIAFVGVASYVTVRKRWKLLLNQPLWYWAASVGLILTSSCSYLLAFHYAPAAQVDLINYQWPMVLALTLSILPGQRWSWIYLAGAVIGMAGIWCLFLGSDFTFLTTKEGIVGSICAGIGCLSWVGYSLVSRLRPKVPAEMVTMTSFFAVIVFGAIQLVVGTPFIPLAVADWGWIAFWGICVFGMAYTLWDLGMCRGNPRTTILFSYLTPAGSVLMLVVFGLAEAGWSLGIATALVVAGSIVGNLKKTDADPIESSEIEEESAAA